MLASLLISKVATFKQSNSLPAIFPYVHFCLTTSQEYWHSSICWHSSIRSPSTLNIITSYYYYYNLISSSNAESVRTNTYKITIMHYLLIYITLVLVLNEIGLGSTATHLEACKLPRIYIYIPGIPLTSLYLT